MKILSKEMQEKGKEYVYLAEFVGGFCKIGISNNPKKRLNDIQRKNQIPIKEYFLVEGYFELENFLHKQFKENRRYSEWFELDFKYLIQYVEKLNYIYLKKEKKENKNEYVKDKSNIYIKDSVLYKIIEEKETWEKEKRIEKDFNDLINEKCCFFKVCLEEKIKIKKEMVLETIKYIIFYNNFLENLKIKIGDEQEIIFDNISLVCNLLKIANFIEFTNTEGKDDKQIYEMVKKYLEENK